MVSLLLAHHSGVLLCWGFWLFCFKFFSNLKSNFMIFNKIELEIHVTTKVNQPDRVTQTNFVTLVDQEYTRQCHVQGFLFLFWQASSLFSLYLPDIAFLELFLYTSCTSSLLSFLLSSQLFPCLLTLCLIQPSFSRDKKSCFKVF